RSGTLWEGRYKASLIDSQSYLLTCMRYIELNPVRANMVAALAIIAGPATIIMAWGKKIGVLHPIRSIVSWAPQT
ncbi:MAG: transposase, partial [Chloroflexota bacterium]|nr:transposase [Chloroflexota bacterium]